ncbi:MAG TPA: M14 family metallopeptidase [Fimbriimonadaceae bacterium]|nr:M14 family metallopeptidase [Fimbriimonadaceae bacterium]
MLALGFAALLLASPQAPDWPQTRAERTNYTETSHYEDVVAFVKALQAKGAPVSLQWMGNSAEGRPMPLVIASRPFMSTPEEARRSGRPIIYIEANIHAGEVEGKEAAQALLRDWCKQSPSVLDKAVILMTPIYNIDGNEKFGPVERNRPEQNGPGEVGVRPNGQNYDLNRDCIKAESPEMRGVLEYVWKGWDPDVVLDLHTTDGTRHGYELTYSPPLNPNTDPEVMKYARDELLPQVRAQLRKQNGIDLFDYGNVERRGDERAWYSFEPFGRYVTNYAGLRNRIAILSEATTFIPFKDRVLATYEFVQACVDHVLKNAKRVVAMTRAADERVISWGTDPSKAPALGVRWDFDSRGSEDVLLEKLAPGEKRPLTGRPKELAKEKMKIFDRFKPTKTAAFPAAYLISPAETATVDLLRRHGIVVEKMLSGWEGEADVFHVTAVNEAAQAFQGHKLMRVEGGFTRAHARFAQGSYLVRTAQPLGTLAFYILEPESTDGAAAWGFFSQPPAANALYPVVKCPLPPAVPTELVK